MAIGPGIRVGPYEVTALIGEGGMGKVYRATDTNLKRTVAIKVLPEAVATDAERVARFQREAEVLARLNHPNIAQIHGLEKTDGTTALVMELVEGPTLADRIAHGPIPIDEALPIAQQIVEALEAAHERGIVHRDLKPANIKLRPDGTVKVLDFGLAKALEPVPADTDTAQVPTVTSPAMTRLGVILGTAAYMSPEQARGRAVDKRSDVWAFGCVMFEMLAGMQLFGGEDVTESIASIVRAEPDWGKLPSDTPAAIRRLLRRCLAKDPKERLMDIGVARLEIKDALTAPFSEASEPAAPLRRARLPWFVAALSVAVTLAMVASSLQRHPAEPFPMRFEMVPPPGLSLNSLAFSPDGKQLAFVAPVDGVPSLWVRRLDQDSAHSVPGTNDASFPFWAPDGGAIGFFANGKLLRVDFSGGAPLTLADVTVGRGGSWSQDGVILFAPALDSGLMRVAAAGGVPVSATKLLPGQRVHRWPQFLPDGRHFLFSSLGEGASSGLFLASLDGNPPVRLLDAVSGVYASGHLVFVRGDTLNAASFDVERMKLTGDSVTVLQGVADPGAGRSAVSFSSTGLFAYVRGSFNPRRLVWVNRAGTIVGSVGQLDTGGIANPELSPDGRRVAVTRHSEINSPSNVWLIDIDRGVPTRLTFGSGSFNAPFWSPDGKRVLFRYQAGGAQDLFVKAVDGLSDAKPLFQSKAYNKTPSGWSPDGRAVLYLVPGDDLIAVEVENGKSFPIAATAANEGWGEFSPDGRFVAYQSNESGRFEIYVRTFPGADGKWLASEEGGTQPRWRRDGKELYYVAPDNELMAVPVVADKTGRTLRTGKPLPLFRTQMVTAGAFGVVTVASGPKQQYAVAPDGRFLMIVPVAETAAPTPISIVVNWPATLKR